MKCSHGIVSAFLVALLALTGVACSVGASAGGEEEDAPIDGKLDSFRAPTRHGTFVFGEEEEVAITADQRFHTWEVQLSGDSKVKLSLVGAHEDGYSFDVVLYVYKRGADGTYGRYSMRSERGTDELRAAVMEAELGAGVYRLLAKSYSTRTDGLMNLEVDCLEGACLAPTDPPTQCIFPSSPEDLYDSERFAMRDPLEIADAAELTPHSRARDLLMSTAAALGLSHDSPTRALAALGGSLECARLIDLFSATDYDLCFGARGEGVILDEASEAAAVVRPGRNGAGLVLDCVVSEPVPTAACGDVVGALVASCDPAEEEDGFGSCAKNLYPGVEALAYAVGCCSQERAPEGCREVFGDRSVSVGPAIDPSAWSSVEGVVEFPLGRGVSVIQSGALPRAILARVYAGVASALTTSCDNLPAAPFASPVYLERDALIASLRADVDNEESIYSEGPLTSDVVEALVEHVQAIDAQVFSAYKVTFGSESCESWGETTLVLDTARATVLAITKSGGN